ncbi:unnamed protein product [Phytomonas sp. EM1]|nr:unnamed protein product [Phytomonas sp. EM1]|eukprot:CCW62892.1 unnamed protein product [Phytomonas sp. isolate EM1]
MEFRLAAEGKVEELRQWLRQHPDRINIPSATARFTLLYTAISNCRRVDLASLQLGENRYFETVRMLCEEFMADVGAPSGGCGNTPVHLCVQNGEEGMLRYLISVLHAPIRRNALGETPLDLAERGRTESSRRCAALLREELHRREGHPSKGGGGSGGGEASPRHGGNVEGFRQTRVPPPSGVWLPFQMETTVGSSTSVAPSAFPSPPLSNAFTPTTSGSTAPLAKTPSFPPPSSSPVGLKSGGTPPPRTSYLHRDLTHLKVLPNPDLRAFRAAYGDGFSFTQCRHHYEIRGLLPYRFEKVVYHTPVILFVDLAATGTAPWRRYRALIDLQHLGGYAISRKALYVDPLSGVILPSAREAVVEGGGRDLLDFVRTALIENFERVPPMVGGSSPYGFPVSPVIGEVGTPGDRFRFHHSRSTPAYLRDMLQRRTPRWLLIYRVLQDFSRFGDGLFRYDAAHDVAVGEIPILRTTKTTGGGGSGGGGSSRARDHLYNAYPFLGIAAAASEPVEMEGVEFLVRVPVRLLFGDVDEAGRPASSSGEGGYRALPRVFLLSAAEEASFAGFPPFSCPPTLTAWGYACFKGLIQDRRTGLVRPEVIASAPSVSRLPVEGRSKTTEGEAAGGGFTYSLYELLVFLQNRLSDALEGVLNDSRDLPRASPFFPSPLDSSGSPKGLPSAGKSLLDDLFECPEAPPRGGSANTGLVAGEEPSTSCLLCGVRAQRVGLLPCRHRPLCGECAAKYKSHCRGGVGASRYAGGSTATTPQGREGEAPLQLDYFSCPVCRERALGTEEVAA